mgnify:CR=1 FL=1
MSCKQADFCQTLQFRLIVVRSRNHTCGLPFQKEIDQSDSLVGRLANSLVGLIEK